VENNTIDLTVHWTVKPTFGDFVMLSTQAAWFLATKRLTGLEYAVLFGAIGCAEFGGKVAIDKTMFASMLAADRSAVSKAVNVLVQKSVLIDEGDRFGNMRYYRLNRYLIAKGRQKPGSDQDDYKRLEVAP
jgi:hypothetical protein